MDNCLTPQKAVKRLIDLVQCKLIEQIDDSYNFYAQDAEHQLITPFEAGDHFYKQEPYCDFTLELYRTDQNFVSVVDTMEAVSGIPDGSVFAVELAVEVKKLVDGRIQYHRMKEAEYEQQKLHMESGLQHENLVYVWNVRQDDPSHGVDSQIHIPRADGMPVLQG